MEQEQAKPENSPFIKAFTLAILKTINPAISLRIYEEKPVINADLVPRMHETIVQKRILSERKPEIRNIKTKLTILKKPVPQKQVQKIIKKEVLQNQPAQQETHKPLPAKNAGQFTSQAHPSAQIQTGFYGKISPFIQDITISSIECPGAGKNIIITRAGQKVYTKISLTPKEIKEILEKIAEQARVPLIEGVFRAAVENFIISAIISSVVGTKFVIKKQTPYSLLEK